MILTGQFPVIDAGEVREGPAVMPLDLEIRLNDGREIYMTKIEQRRTHGGMLCGLPFDPERVAIEAVKAARAWDGGFHECPVIVPANIVRGTKPAPSNPQFASIGPRRWAMLPPVTTFAQFTSEPTTGNRNEVYSSALFVWWQGQFGIPRDDDWLGRIRSVDWDSCARDWTP